ncbi:hypothetical protein BJ508DRAFT_335212 [Ascobolus immersus RN42]|uniref:Uncharacterized protein n=1 Tax=Ascobolus immersus RN42 TaxID=1160509 RepID=A0A3N4HF96_ASCIM|nr:hypothetical protein BJ508DRAFT_335212 [Ascobolus immersus RN42]
MSHQQKASIPPTGSTSNFSVPVPIATRNFTTPEPLATAAKNASPIHLRVHLFVASPIIHVNFNPKTNGIFPPGTCEVCEQEVRVNQRVVYCRAERCCRIRHYGCEMFQNDPLHAYPCTGRTGMRMNPAEAEEWKRAQVRAQAQFLLRGGGRK